MDSKTAETERIQHRSVRDVLVYNESYQKEIDEYGIYEHFGETRIGKRMLDLILGTLGVIVFFLLFPFVALAIKISSPGPIIFKQKRTGYKGMPFTCYKFRTMHTRDNIKRIDGKPLVTKQGDIRIFKFGQHMRRLNIDELPQLINVIKGDISLVGPRPYAVDECRYWNETFEDHHLRYLVKPGLSGLAQVKGYRGGTHDVEHMRRRLDWDLYYTKNISFKLDVYVVWPTLLQMFKYETNAH